MENENVKLVKLNTKAKALFVLTIFYDEFAALF